MLGGSVLWLEIMRGFGGSARGFRGAATGVWRVGIAPIGFFSCDVLGDADVFRMAGHGLSCG